MKRSTYLWSIIALTILRLPAAHEAGRKASAVPKPQAVKAYGQLPLSFEANRGQTDQRVKFLSHGSGYSLFLNGDEAVLALKKPGGSTARDQQLKPAVPSAGPPAVVRMKLVGANAAAKVTGLTELPGKSNYFIGNDPKKWRTNVPNYAKVKYTSVYPGVDLVYYGNQRQLEYDFVVQPGADPRQIALQLVAPASSRDAAKAKTAALRIDKNGNSVVATEGGEVIFHKPVVYQPATDNGQWTKDKHFVSGNYVLKNDRLTFEVASYDKTKPLVIDPTLAYSTYLGGSGDDFGSGIAIDPSGNAYVTGGTVSADFPNTGGAFQTTYGGNMDAFVAKLNATGSALLYSTYLGGSGEDFAVGMAIDSAGNAYVTGFTWAFNGPPNFPTTAGAFQTTSSGISAFVSKLSGSGSALLYSTYLGGSSYASASGISVDASGSAYVTGITQGGFPTTAGAFQTTYHGGEDSFVSKLNAAGSALIYSTYLGGSSLDDVFAIAVDGSGNAYVTGVTGSTDFPTTPGAFQTTYGGHGNAFVSKLNASGSALRYSTFLGGRGDPNSGYDAGESIAVDALGNAYITGGTVSSDFPTTPGAFQTIYGGTGVLGNPNSGDAFVSNLNVTGSALLYSTYLGGSGSDVGNGIAVDALGNAYVTGFTRSTDFPTTAGALQTTYGGNGDAFVSKLNASGSALLYSTYLGGSKTEENADFGPAYGGIAIDAAGHAYVAGSTESSDFPTTTGAFRTTFGGINDAFVSKFSFSPIALFPSSLNFGIQLLNTTSSPKTVALTNGGDATLDISSIVASGSFSETNNCGSSLLAGASCNISVTFKPTSTSTCAETGYLTVTDSGGMQTVRLSGIGTVVTLSVKSLNFGNQAVGTTSVAKMITLTNHATSRVVSIAAITISGLNSPAFAQTHTCGTTLAAGASCTISVTFTPHSKGSKAATLNIWNNGGAAALKVSLSGNGT